MIITFDDIRGWYNLYAESAPLSIKSDQGIPIVDNKDFMLVRYGRFLGVPAEKYIKQMKASLAAGDYPRARQIIAVLDQIMQSSHKNLEIAEVSYECAIALYIMNDINDFSKARELLHQAISKYGNDNIHNKSIGLWALGEVYWQTDMQSDAFISWERSYEIFRFLSTADYESRWYVEKSMDMRETIEYKCSIYP